MAILSSDAYLGTGYYCGMAVCNLAEIVKQTYTKYLSLVLQNINIFSKIKIISLSSSFPYSPLVSERSDIQCVVKGTSSCFLLFPTFLPRDSFLYSIMPLLYILLCSIWPLIWSFYICSFNTI